MNYIQVELTNGRGVNWKELVIFTFEVDKRDDAGKYGKKVFRKPVFVLSEDFSKSYGVQCPKLATTDASVFAITN
jgi:hypothetical protein